MEWDDALSLDPQPGGPIIWREIRCAYWQVRMDRVAGVDEAGSAVSMVPMGRSGRVRAALDQLSSSASCVRRPCGRRRLSEELARVGTGAFLPGDGEGDGELPAAFVEGSNGVSSGDSDHAGDLLVDLPIGVLVGEDDVVGGGLDVARDVDGT